MLNKNGEVHLIGVGHFGVIDGNRAQVAVRLRLLSYDIGGRCHGAAGPACLVSDGLDGCRAAHCHRNGVDSSYGFARRAAIGGVPDGGSRCGRRDCHRLRCSIGPTRRVEGWYGSLCVSPSGGQVTQNKKAHQHQVEEAALEHSRLLLRVPSRSAHHYKREFKNL